MTIAEASKKYEITADTLRYYEKEGLLPFIKRSESGIRVFGESDFGWFSIIHCLKQAGMSIKDIKKYMDMIAEILQTDKAAAGKLEKADMESGELLERTVKEAQELKENALKEAEAYKTQKAKEVTERINTESEKITSAQNEKTTVLDKIFEEKHTQWENEIFDNIISPK